jgi:hypothetical protein
MRRIGRGEGGAMRSKRRRLVVRGAILLLAGAGLSLLFAWGAAAKEAWLGRKGPHGTLMTLASVPPGGDEDFCVARVRRVGYEWWGDMWMRPSAADAAKFERIEWPAFLDSPRSESSVRRSGYACFGWPMKCMSWTELNSARGMMAMWNPEEVQGMVEVSVTDALTVKLPVRPMWTGMVVNVAVLGASVGVMWWGVGLARRWVRRRRGRCLRCGYVLGGVSGGLCPECGEGMVVG